MFRAHFNIFISLPAITEEPADEQLYLWRRYLQAWVTGELDRDEWSEEFGIDLSDFDWEAWRVAMNYSKSR
jgi:hypothetical protein